MTKYERHSVPGIRVWENKTATFFIRDIRLFSLLFHYPMYEYLPLSGFKETHFMLLVLVIKLQGRYLFYFPPVNPFYKTIAIF